MSNANDISIRAAFDLGFAAAKGAVVATPATVPLLDALGIPKIDDVRGRYPNEIVAYWATANAYRGKLAYKGLANQRPALHAAILGFDHPRSGERLRFEAPLPADLAQALARLGRREEVP